MYYKYTYIQYNQMLKSWSAEIVFDNSFPARIPEYNILINSIR